jgi:hypothetical protein
MHFVYRSFVHGLCNPCKLLSISGLAPRNGYVSNCFVADAGTCRCDCRRIMISGCGQVPDLAESELTSEYFLDDDRFLGKVAIKADPDLRDAFFAANLRTRDLARLRLDWDVNALFAMTRA